MGFDLSIKDYVLGVFLTAATPASAAIGTDGLLDPLAGADNQWAWSNQNAIDLSAQLANYADDDENIRGEKGTDLFIGADLNQKINLSPLAHLVNRLTGFANGLINDFGGMHRRFSFAPR
ncbi:MAG: hypothetical protein M0R77_09370 [Gammaproteobacteria bacterium]|nr:hypothetical protein [Gammaproteobacteria bacterium]